MMVYRSRDGINEGLVGNGDRVRAQVRSVNEERKRVPLLQTTWPKPN